MTNTRTDLVNQGYKEYFCRLLSTIPDANHKDKSNTGQMDHNLRQKRQTSVKSIKKLPAQV